MARVRRKESLRSWAQRIGISVPTLLKLESGDPGVSIGAFASALWLIGRDGELARLAEPATDSAALELDVRAAKALGARRATSARSAAAKRAQKIKADE